MTGLRERKKRQTRQHISDVATGLFLERGFDAVTVAEVAEAAEVSVNTVYNYFPAKEDLFFDREDEIVDRPSARVRQRRPGQSAAEAIFDGMREDMDERPVNLGMVEGFEHFMSVVTNSSSLMARLMRMQFKTAFHLGRTLAEEAGCEPDDPLPELVAAQLMAVHANLNQTVRRCAMAGRTVDEVKAELSRRLDISERLLGQEVRDFARRPAGSGAAAASGPEAAGGDRAV
ncbi:TetR family transcriptional regulator [Streptomyces sp. 3MP-14]|uniref:TetR family transcriptional regulator n=1 Tax=Streptomyces mimosae TaxID=2586635 RepID=A0A5N6A870_9ACTN|nr:MULTISPECIES: TetR/AcrR family transcriptional regulator [Streptomyces]KAB8164555.1 TetR family transcriptional regulator [Streptomyces mimosae]KAB8175471.1 TetR family transcriptional regulator [Streptomyces sp. 3MP-14]